MKTYKSKLVFVTGGSEGIGKEVSKAFVAGGAHVVALSRSIIKLKRALAEFEKCRVSPDQKIIIAALDVTKADEVDDVLGTLVKEYGVPDYIINCAGYARPGYIQDLEIDHFHKMMDLNYFGIVNVCKALIPSLISEKKGYIVNTSSMAGFIGLFGYTGYCASKYAVVGFSEALKRELLPYGINVSVLCPPNTKTPGLAEENKFKPAEVLKTEEKAKPVEAELVAKELLKALSKKSFMIVPSFDGKIAYKLSRFAPGVLSNFVKRPEV
jgi:3-dehydrosphinganine reductase